MPSQSYLDFAESASRTAVLIEEVARERLGNILLDYREGKVTPRQIRHRVGAVVRAAYRASREVAREFTDDHVQKGLIEKLRFATSDYLKSLLKDVNQALREFHLSERGDDKWNEVARRLGLSVGNSAIRGYGDGLVEAGIRAKKQGLKVTKVWHVESDSNVCPECSALDGKSVEVGKRFGFKGAYVNDASPPRHPNCRCTLILHVESK